MQYQVGDLVLWYKGPVPARSGGKFRNRWFGPYVVTRVTPNNVVALEDPDGEPVGKHVNVNRLKPYKAPELSVVPMTTPFETSHPETLSPDVHTPPTT
ncbi:hypothetical protein R1flu_012247 [Riccia fluitans]|uniref:Uncharacterized protein n=1 Tax=Riccia fluitans TaxID=41844 RepID=A0ABD1ZB14_9MARC